MNALTKLNQEVITKLNELVAEGKVANVLQDRGQYENPHLHTYTSYPVLYVKLEPTLPDDYIKGRQYFDVEVVVSIVNREITHTDTYTLFDLFSDVNKKLSGQHFDQLCLPLRRIEAVQDYQWEATTYSYMTYFTSTDDRDIPEAEVTFDFTPNVYEVSTTIGPEEEERIDIFRTI